LLYADRYDIFAMPPVIIATYVGYTNNDGEYSIVIPNSEDDFRHDLYATSRGWTPTSLQPIPYLPFSGTLNAAFGFIPDDWIWYDVASSWLMRIGWMHTKKWIDIIFRKSTGGTVRIRYPNQTYKNFVRLRRAGSKGRTILYNWTRFYVVLG
jgi:hypothetical protein